PGRPNRGGGFLMMNEKVATELKGSVRGDVILPDDGRYDEARKVYNAMIDKRPAAVVRCTGVADVIAAVKAARAAGLAVAIRGGDELPVQAPTRQEYRRRSDVLRERRCGEGDAHLRRVHLSRSARTRRLLCVADRAASSVHPGRSTRRYVVRLGRLLDRPTLR